MKNDYPIRQRDLELMSYRRHRAYDRWALTLAQPYPFSPINLHIRLAYTGDRFINDIAREGLEPYQYDEDVTK